MTPNMKLLQKKALCAYMDRECDASCYAAFQHGDGIVCERSYTDIRKVEMLEEIAKALREIES